MDKIDDKKGNNILHERDKEDKAILSSLPVAIVKELDGYERQIGEAEPLPNSYVRFMERSGEELDGKLIYFVKLILMSVYVADIRSFFSYI